jgi:hypothetical protein
MVEQGAAIQFVSADGTPVLGYRDLHAYDSRGRALPVEALDRDDAGAALTQFRAFINQVEAYINARILSPAQGRMLIDQANDIIPLVGG